jgi:hypothetical protein
MTAPKRIWLDVSLVDSPRKTLACNLATAKQECALQTDEQYIRADLVAELVQEAYLAGFIASAEGWNGEYSFQDYGKCPTEDEDWIAARDAALRAIKETDT